MSTFWKFASWTARRHARLGNPLGKMTIPLFAIGLAPQTPQVPKVPQSVQEVPAHGADSTPLIPQVAQV